MNTNHKARLFALYVWQIVFFQEGHKFDNPLMLAPQDLDYRMHTFGGYLQLRPISGLTDEEKFKIASLVCTRIYRHFKPEDISFEKGKHDYDVILMVKRARRYIVQIMTDGCAFIDYYMGSVGSQHYYCPQYAATDCLRSFGIALPVTMLDDAGQTVTYSVEQQVEMKWIVLEGEK